MIPWDELLEDVMASQLKAIEVTVSVPVGRSPLEPRYIQQVCAEVERLVQAGFDDARYLHHEIGEAVTA